MKKIKTKTLKRTFILAPPPLKPVFHPSMFLLIFTFDTYRMSRRVITYSSSDQAHH